MSKLDQPIYRVAPDGSVRETTVRDVGGYVELISTAEGPQPRYHVLEGELWRLEPVDCPPTLVEKYPTRVAAEEALDAMHWYRFWMILALPDCFVDNTAAEKYAVQLKGVR